MLSRRLKEKLFCLVQYAGLSRVLVGVAVSDSPSGAWAEVVENLEELEDDGEIYESIEDIWPDYPSKDDFFRMRKNANRLDIN